MKTFLIFLIGCGALYLLGMTVTSFNIPQPYAALGMIALACGGYTLVYGIDPPDC